MENTRPFEYVTVFHRGFSSHWSQLSVGNKFDRIVHETIKYSMRVRYAIFVNESSHQLHDSRQNCCPLV